MTRQDLKLYDESFQKLRGDVSETTVSSGDVIILVDVITCRASMWGCCFVVYPVCFVLSSAFPSGKHSSKLSVLVISNLGEVWNKELLNQLSSLPTAVSMRCFSGCLNTLHLHQFSAGSKHDGICSPGAERHALGNTLKAQHKLYPGTAEQVWMEKKQRISERDVEKSGANPVWTQPWCTASQDCGPYVWLQLSDTRLQDSCSTTDVLHADSWPQDLVLA